MLAATDVELERLVLTVDTGASDTVIPPRVARQISMLHSSKVGTEYEVANGEVIENFRDHDVVLEIIPEGSEMVMTVHVVAVHKPLLAVSSILEVGNQVIFRLDPRITLANGTTSPLSLNGGT